MGQALLSAALVLEITGPFLLVSLGQHNVAVHLILRLLDGGTHVTAPDAEFHGGKAAVVVAVNQARASHGMNVGNFGERNGFAVLGRHHQATDFGGRLPKLGLVAHPDREFALAFVELGGLLAAHRHFKYRAGIGLAHAVAGHALLIEVDMKLGLADVTQHAQIIDAAHRF